MPRENGGIVGIKGLVNLGYASGVFTAKTQFINNQAAIWPRSGSVFLAVSHASSPYFSVYPFSSLGFGAKLSDPVTTPTGTGTGVAFSPDGKIVAVSHDNTPFISAYPFSGSGIGTRYSSPGTLPVGGTNGIAFNPSSNTVAVTTTTPGVQVYPINNISGFGTKYSDSASTTGTTYSVDFSPDGNNIALSHGAGSYITVLPFSISSGIGSKYSDHPSNYTANITAGYGIKFHPSGNFLVAGYASSGTGGTNRIERTYSFSSGVGFNAGFFDTTTTSRQLSGLSTSGDNVYGVDVHPTGNDVAFTTSGTNLSSYITVFSFNETTGYTTIYTSPATNLTGAPINGAGRNVAFSPDGNFLAAGHLASPFVGVYPWTTGTGFGTKIANPSTLPASTGYGVAWGRV